MATTTHKSLTMDDLVDAPHISVLGIPKPFMVRHGDPAYIRVQVSGFPTPTVRWYVGHHQVFEDAQYQLVHEATQSTLFVSWADDELGNGVKVLATNQGGEDKAYIDIKLYKVLTGSRQRRKTRLTSTKSNQSLAFRRRRREDEEPGRMNKSFGSFGSISDIGGGEEENPWKRLNKSAEDIVDDPQKTNNSSAFKDVNHNQSSESGVINGHNTSYRLKPKYNSTDDVLQDVRRPRAPPEQIAFEQDNYEGNYRALPRNTQSLPVLRKKFSLPTSSGGETSGLDIQFSETDCPPSPAQTDMSAGNINMEPAGERQVLRRTPRELKRSSKRDSNRKSKQSSQTSQRESQNGSYRDSQTSLPQDPYQAPQRYSQGSTSSSKRTSNQSLPEQDNRYSANIDPNSAVLQGDLSTGSPQTIPSTGTSNRESYTGSQSGGSYPYTGSQQQGVQQYGGIQQMDHTSQPQVLNIPAETQSNLWEMSGNRMSNLCEQYLGDYQFLEQSDRPGNNELPQYSTPSQQTHHPQYTPQQQFQEQPQNQQIYQQEQQNIIPPQSPMDSSMPQEQMSLGTDSQRSSVRKKKKKRVSPPKDVNANISPISPSYRESSIPHGGHYSAVSPPSPIASNHKTDPFHPDVTPSMDTSTAHSFLDSSIQSVGSSMYDPQSMPPLPPKMRDMQEEAKPKKKHKKKILRESVPGSGSLYRTSSGTYMETDLDSHFRKIAASKGDVSQEAIPHVSPSPSSPRDADYPKAKVVYVDIYGNPLDPQPNLEISGLQDSSFVGDQHSQSFSEGVFMPNGDMKLLPDEVTSGSVVIETREKMVMSDGKIKKKKIRRIKKQPLKPNTGIETNIDDVMDDRQFVNSPTVQSAEPYQRLSREVTPSDQSVFVEPAVTKITTDIDFPGSTESKDVSRVSIMSDNVFVESPESLVKIKKVKKKKRTPSAVDPPVEEAVIPVTPARVEEAVIETAIVSNDPVEMRTPSMDRHVPLKRESRTYEEVHRQSVEMDTSRQSAYSDLSFSENFYQPVPKQKKVVKKETSPHNREPYESGSQSLPPIDHTATIPPELPMKLRDIPMQIDEYDDIPSFARPRETKLDKKPVNGVHQQYEETIIDTLEREIPLIDTNDVNIHKVRKIRKGKKRPKLTPSLYDPIIPVPDTNQENQYPEDMPLESPPPVPHIPGPDLPLKIRDMPPPPDYMLNTTDSSELMWNFGHETEASEMQTTVKSPIEMLTTIETSSLSTKREAEGERKRKPPKQRPPVPAKPVSPIPKEDTVMLVSPIPKEEATKPVFPIPKEELVKPVSVVTKDEPKSPPVSSMPGAPVMKQVPISSLVETKPYVPTFNTKPVSTPPAYRPLFTPYVSKSKPPLVTTTIPSSVIVSTSTSSTVTISSSWSTPSPLKPITPLSKPPIVSPKATSPPISPKPRVPPILPRESQPKLTSPPISPRTSKPMTLPKARSSSTSSSVISSPPLSPPISPKPMLPPKPMSPSISSSSESASPVISPRSTTDKVRQPMPIGRPPKSPARAATKSKEKDSLSETQKEDKGKEWKGSLSRSMPFSDLHRSQDNLVMSSEFSTVDMSYNRVDDSDDDIQFKQRLRTKSYDNLALVEHQSRQRERDVKTNHERSRSTGCLIEGRLAKLGRRTLTQEMLVTKITTKEEITIVEPKSKPDFGSLVRKPSESAEEKLLTQAIKESLPPHQDERKVIDGVLIVDIYDDSQTNIDTEVHVLNEKVVQKTEPEQIIISPEPIPQIIITEDKTKNAIYDQPESPAIQEPIHITELPQRAEKIINRVTKTEFDMSDDTSDEPNTSKESMDLPRYPDGPAPVAGSDDLSSSMEQEDDDLEDEREDEHYHSSSHSDMYPESENESAASSDDDVHPDYPEVSHEITYPPAHDDHQVDDAGDSDEANAVLITVEVLNAEQHEGDDNVEIGQNIEYAPVTVQRLSEEYDDQNRVEFENHDDEYGSDFVPNDLDIMVHRNSIVLDDDESLDDLLESLDENLQQVENDAQVIKDVLRTKQFDPAPRQEVVQTEQEQYTPERESDLDLVKYPHPPDEIPDNNDDGGPRLRFIPVVENVYLETVSMDDYRKEDKRIRKPSTDTRNLPEVDPNSIIVYECGEMLYMYNHIPETMSEDDLARARRENVLQEVAEELSKRTMLAEDKERRQEIILQRSLSEMEMNPGDAAMQKVLQHIQGTLKPPIPSGKHSVSSNSDHDEDLSQMKILEETITERFDCGEPEVFSTMLEGDGALSNSVIYYDAVHDKNHSTYVQSNDDVFRNVQVTPSSCSRGERADKPPLSTKPVFPKTDEVPMRPRRGSCGSTESTESTETQSSQDTVICVSHQTSVSGPPPHSHHDNDSYDDEEEDLPNDGVENNGEKNYEIPVDPGMETFFDNDNVVVKVVTKDDGQTKKIEFLEKGVEQNEEAEDEYSDDECGTDSDSVHTEEIDDSDVVYDDDCIAEALEAVPEVSEPEKQSEDEDVTVENVVDQDPNYVQSGIPTDVRQREVNGSHADLEPEPVYGASAAANQRLEDIDTDVYAQKAFVESIISTVAAEKKADE